MIDLRMTTMFGKIYIYIFLFYSKSCVVDSGILEKMEIEAKENWGMLQECK